MSIAEKFEVIADKVYEKGLSDKESEFWDIFQNNGKRGAYAYAFNYWNCEYIRPKYKVVSTEATRACMFQRCSNLKKVEKEYFDWSKAPAPAYAANGNHYTFQFDSNLEEIEDIGLSGEYYSGTYHNCEKLHTIEVIRCTENTAWAAEPFYNCKSLQNVKFEGVMATAPSFEWCPLNAESMLSLIGVLKEYPVENSQQLKLSSTTKALLTEEMVLSIAAKGWEVM